MRYENDCKHGWFQHCCESEHTMPFNDCPNCHIDALQAENEKLKELLATERMSNEKTYDHNNRLINEVDRLREALEWLLKEAVDESDFWTNDAGWERIEKIRVLLKA